MKKLIKQFEGLRLEAYRCPAGVWTIGYGHTAGVTPGMKITAAEAERLLDLDLEPIRRALPEGLNQHQRRALASLAFNIGLTAFSRSTLLRLVKARPDDPAIRAEFTRWKYSRGRVLEGLVRRRAAEADEYFQYEEEGQQ